MVVSVVSLMVSIHHGKVMESLVDANTKMVEASTLPVLNFAASNADDQGQPVISLAVANVGVGPAIVDWLDLSWKGRKIESKRQFLTDCCGSPNGWFVAEASGATLAAGQEVQLLTVPQTPANAEMWTRLDAARNEVTARACYCSVLEECWVTDFEASRPTRVTTCAAAHAGDMSPPHKAGH